MSVTNNYIFIKIKKRHFQHPIVLVLQYKMVLFSYFSFWIKKKISYITLANAYIEYHEIG